MFSKIKYPSFIIIASLGPFIILEIILRVFFGFPHGQFNYLLSSKEGLYPRNATLNMDYGIMPYTVKTNSFGMRGREISLEKPAGVTRIIALGDSVTDGFFVDNDQAYPCLLEKRLVSDKYNVEVLNVARGGGSIDKEFGFLRLVTPLAPDIVVLTFVTNDIYDIRGKTREELVNMKFRVVPKELPEWLMTKTAIGELVGDLKLRMKYRNYKLLKRSSPGADIRQSEKGMEYAKNIEIFNKMTVNNEAYVLKDDFSDQTNKLVADYFFALSKLKTYCDENRMKLVLAYFPSYSQVYDRSVSLKLRDMVKDACGRFAIPFIDLTGPIRKAGDGKVIYFAPYDFHCNGDGNKVIADSIAEYIVAEKIVSR